MSYWQNMLLQQWPLLENIGTLAKKVESHTHNVKCVFLQKLTKQMWLLNRE